MKRHHDVLFLIAAVTVLLLMLSACAGTSPVVINEPSFNVVVANQGKVSTLHSHDGVEWTSHLHDSLPADACYDIAISPTGGQRYVAFSHANDKGVRQLKVLTGYGPDKWTGNHSAVDIPPTEFCSRPLIRHLHDGIYAIMWLGDGALHTALFDSNKRIGKDLYLTEVVRNRWFEAASIKLLSLVYYKDTVNVVWSPASQDRIMLMRGKLGPKSIEFLEPAYHEIDHTSISNVIVDQERLFVAVTGKDRYMLMSTADGEYWKKETTCYNTDRMPFIFPLLFIDPAGAKRYVRSNNYAGEVNWLQSFADCDTASFRVPYSTDRIDYYPGVKN